MQGLADYPIGQILVHFNMTQKQIALTLSHIVNGWVANLVKDVTIKLNNR